MPPFEIFYREVSLRRQTLLFALGILPLPLWAAQCAVDPLAKYTTLGGNPNDNKIHVTADTSQGTYTRSDFNGAVQVQQGDRHLFAPHVTFLRDDNLFRADSGVTVGSPNAAIRGEGGLFHTDNKEAEFSSAEYYYSGAMGGVNGRANDAKFNRTTNIDTFENVTYSTCDRAAPTWHLQAKHLTLDHNTNFGTAKNVTFQIKNTPVFWLPYMTFPINGQRVSGFLMPTIGDSSSRGFELTLPFYWNIAPNQDATITPHLMTARGVGLDGQYRFMTEHQYGQLDGSFLPNDRKYDNDKRWQVDFKHQYKFNDHWHTDLRYQKVSDIDYTNDINGDLDIYDDWYLERHFTLYGDNNPWGNVMLRFQDFQRVDPDVEESDKPFSRLPQLTYNKTWNVDNFKFDLNGEAVRFQKTGEGSANRFNTNGAMSYRFNPSYGFFEPKLSMDLTRYYFHPEDDAFRTGTRNRAVPTLSVDTGLYFDRDTKLAGESYTQTIEPRLFYLYTPYRDQSDIPKFDSSTRGLSWNWLFARNRFNGKDKIGDANQLTTALTTRFLRNSDGQEKLKLSVGQIQYFKDRKVGLYGNIKDDNSKSVFVTEGEYHIDSHWRLYGLSFWDPEKHRNRRDVVDLSYHLDADRYIGVGHRYNRENYERFDRDDDYNQISIRGGWRINPAWRVFARYDYSQEYNRTFNILGGLEYDDCCWAWRFVGRRSRDNPYDDKMNNAFFLEFVFKGLGNLGSSTRQVLREEIPEFRPLAGEDSYR